MFHFIFEFSIQNRIQARANFKNRPMHKETSQIQYNKLIAIFLRKTAIFSKPKIDIEENAT